MLNRIGTKERHNGTFIVCPDARTEVHVKLGSNYIIESLNYALVIWKEPYLTDKEVNKIIRLCEPQEEVMEDVV